MSDKFQISSLYTCTIETDKAYKTNTICYFTGSVWVYSVVAKVETASNISRNFCDPMLYWYSVILVSLVLFGLITKCIFLLVISMVYCKYENRTCYSHIINESLGEFV